MTIDLDRRRTLKGAGWAAGTAVILTSAPVPAFAASLRNDPGINGWVLAQWDPGADRPDVSFDSDPSGTDPATPDGAPFGLYVRHVNRTPGGLLADSITNAAITLFVRGTATVSYPENPSTTPNGGGHGRWTLVNGANPSTEPLPDGITYRGYRFEYSGSLSLPQPNGLTNPGPGGGPSYSVFFEDFSVVMNNIRNGNATFWTRREVTVNGGDPLTFQRRAGESGAFERSVAKAPRTAVL